MCNTWILYTSLARTTLHYSQSYFYVYITSHYSCRNLCINCHNNFTYVYIYYYYYLKYCVKYFKIIVGSEKSFKFDVTNNKIKNQITGDINRRRLMHRAKSKSLRISIVIVTAFVIWWTPYYIMMIIFMFLDPDEHVSLK